MSEGVDVETRICVKWQSSRPFEDAPRQSSEFSFMGCRWYLRLIRSTSYEITLNKITDDKPLNGKLDIWTFVTGRNSSDCYSRVATYSDCKSVTIWSCDVPTAKRVIGLDSTYGKWTVYCTFRSDQPTGLPMNKIETINLSTQTDFDWPLSAEVETRPPEDSPSDLESLSLDLGNLLQEKSFPDVTLRCGSRTFSAHRSILSARSDVFAAMFRNRMAESETGTVDVADMDGEVLDMLLKYVYSGKIPDLSEDTVISLYSAADKYSIHALKKACSDWMAGRLTRENCLDFLLLADVCSDKSLRDRVATFAARILESFEDEAWSSFSDEHPKLANFVYKRRFEARPKHVQLAEDEM